MIGNSLQKVFFVRGNADCHDPVAALRHNKKLLQEYRLTIKNTVHMQFFIPLSYLLYFR
jgi:hypothetical protein